MKKRNKYLIKFTDKEISMIHTSILTQIVKLQVLCDSKELSKNLHNKMVGLLKEYNRISDYINLERIRQNGH